MIKTEIIRSDVQPNRSNHRNPIIWLNSKDDSFYYWKDNKWTKIVDGTSRIGTSEERLKLAESGAIQDGVEFNEINTHEASGIQYVTRYIWEDGQWLQIDSPQTETKEKVSLHINTYDGKGKLEGLTISVTDKQWDTVEAYTLDSDGNTGFGIEKGHKYTIAFSTLEGYRSLNDVTLTASFDERSLTFTYLAVETRTERVKFEAICQDIDNQTIAPEDTVNFEDKTITVVMTSSSFDVTLENNAAVFEVPYGEEYKIVTPDVEGYYKINKYALKHTASIPERRVKQIYKYAVSPGIYGVTEEGTMYSYENIIHYKELADTGDTTAAEILSSVVYLYMNTDKQSKLKSNGQGFLFKIDNNLYVAPQKQWANQNVEFTGLPFKQNLNQCLSAIDGEYPNVYDGETYTTEIIANGDTIGVETPAADYCRSQTITLNGEEKRGFLPSFGQLYALSEFAPELASVLSALNFPPPLFSSGGWWSSTQYSSTYAVNLNNGGFYNYYKTNSYSILVAFAL